MSADSKTYLDREIDEKFGDIKDALERIEFQVVKTNGRVSKLEQWQAYVLGFCACVVMLLVPVVVSMINHYFLP